MFKMLRDIQLDFEGQLGHKGRAGLKCPLGLHRSQVGEHGEPRSSRLGARFTFTQFLPFSVPRLIIVTENFGAKEGVEGEDGHDRGDLEVRR